VTARWRAQFWTAGRASLTIVSDDGDVMRLRDTRPGAAASGHELRGTLAAVLRSLESPATLAALGVRLAETGSAIDQAALSAALEELVGRRLVWRSSTQYVALPTPPPRRPMPAKAEAAVGKVDMARYLVDKVRFRHAFA
jgi:hypothetical protein